MALIVIPNTFSAGAVIIASQHNANFSTIATDYNGNIDNTNISASAGISYSKLTLTGSIVNADISTSAAIAASKLNLVSPGGIGTTTPAAGKFTTLEATTTLKLGTTNQGDIIYDNGTSLVRLPPGTSGQVLTTAGAAANPAWGAGSSVSFVSATSISSGTTINITAGQIYLAKVLVSSTGTDVMLIRFNADSSANTYGYRTDASTFSSTTSAPTYSSSNFAATGIAASGASNIVGGEYMDIWIFPSAATYCHGKIIGGTNHASINFTGGYNGGTPTNFSLVCSTLVGTVYLYKYSLS